MRLFVAVEIDERVAQQIIALSDELRRRIEAQAPAARLTWVPRERLHLTLRFVGEVDESRAARIAAALQPPLEAEAFDIVIDGAGAFPPRGAPRVLWAGIVGGEPELIALERQVTARLIPCGVSPERRAYRPHLTLARVREASGLGSVRPTLFEDLPGISGASPVRTITLFQSRLSPKGPTYLALQSTTLRWKN